MRRLRGHPIRFSITVRRPVSAGALLKSIQVRRLAARNCLKMILREDFVQ
jgi:hypothetical protein